MKGACSVVDADLQSVVNTMNKKIKLNPNNLNLRQGCYWYPCHSNISEKEYDCRCCYCPMYEVCSSTNNVLFGGYWLYYVDREGNQQKVFACEKCTILHKKKYVDLYLSLKKQGLNQNEILDRLIVEYQTPVTE